MNLAQNTAVVIFLRGSYCLVPTSYFIDNFIKIKTLQIILFKTRTTSNYLQQQDKNLTKNRVSKKTNMRLGKTFILCKTTQKSISENLRNKFDNMTRKLNFLRKSKMSKHLIYLVQYVYHQTCSNLWYFNQTQLFKKPQLSENTRNQIRKNNCVSDQEAYCLNLNVPILDEVKKLS